jgi:hypothetical protein
MLGRLLIGIVKGILVGGLVGLALAKLGFAAPGVLIAYAAAAMTGVLIGLVAGKPIWAKDAKIEAGMKAFVGALLASGLMYAVRRWLTMELPVPLGELAGPNASLGEPAASSGTIGGLAITSLATIAALLGGFYEADNNPADTEDAASSKSAEATGGKRVAVSQDEAEAEDEDEAPPEKRAKK